MRNITHGFLGIAFMVMMGLLNSVPASSQTIPQPNYKEALVGDPVPIISTPYTYRAIVNSVYDSDTINIDIDLGFGIWSRNVNVRYAGTNAYEVKRSKSKRFRGKSIGSAHIKKGFQCRDLMIEWFGGDPSLYPHKAQYHDMVPRNLHVSDILRIPASWLKYGGPEVIIQTLADKSGKFGRPLVIIWKNGNNLNQWLVRSGCADLNWYDGKKYLVTSPIVPR